MRIIHVGASGTIGSSVKSELEKRHEIISVGSTSGDIQMDVTSIWAIRWIENSSFSESTIPI